MTEIARATRRRLGSALAVMTALALIAAPAVALYGGGGVPSSDCLAVLNAAVNFPAARPSMIRCTDGDPVCDADLTINGQCAFSVGVCVNSTFDPTRCTLQGVDEVLVDHAEDNGLDPKFDTGFQSLQDKIESDLTFPNAAADSCATAATIYVPIRGPFGTPGRHYCVQNYKLLKLATVSTFIGGKVYSDTDMLRMICLPAAKESGGCDPRTLFSGTYDRIQKQVFTQSCATGTCHDSQSQRADLLLEPGAFPGNLVNAAPTNASAAAAGWTRLTPGDPTTSYVYRKIQGGLPDLSYGERMPWHRPQLEKNLREAIRLWILDGASPGGWVTGTD
ncbi:MAG: hypothetical protein HY699_23310 [Deltaproteobacteria bacterium]|nr:hypothetical protein [Deltaproteobacteria bacterium]